MDFEEREEPWDRGSYRTGSTKPPKNHSKLMTLLLAAVILLGGVASVLGILNIRLFQSLRQQPQGEQNLVAALHTDPVDTTGSTEDTAAPQETDKATMSTVPQAQLQLNHAPNAVPNVPQEGGLSLQEIYTKAIPSVVSISCQTARGSASGTGVVLSENGYLVTNCHVVEDAQRIQVELTGGAEYEAQVVGTDGASDLAVLYIPAQDLTPAEFGDSSALQVGDAVAAIGDPLGAELRGTMTNGIISAINRDITTGGRTMTLIQTNAALNSGNSGGPLLNCYGQVIGINTMKIGDYMDSAGVEGLGFAIPSTTVQEIVNQLISQGYVSGRPSLGLTGESVSIFYQMYYRLPEGLYLTQVEEDSQAAQAGLQPGDILLSLDGARITDSQDLTEQLYDHQVGDTVELVVYREGRQYRLELTLGESKG